jgi:hypothetical protein
MGKLRWIDNLSYQELLYILSLVDHPLNNALTISSWERVIAALDADANDDDLNDLVSMLEVGTGRYEWRHIHGTRKP